MNGSMCDKLHQNTMNLETRKILDLNLLISRKHNQSNQRNLCGAIEWQIFAKAK